MYNVILSSPLSGVRKNILVLKFNVEFIICKFIFCSRLAIKKSVNNNYCIKRQEGGGLVPVRGDLIILCWSHYYFSFIN